MLVVSEAFVPLLHWREVSVRRELRQELTRLERFLLEMALALDTVDAEEFEELVSLPRSVLAGGMSRLVAGGAVCLLAEGRFQVVAEVAARFLQQEAVVHQVTSTADFALLPRSGDLLAVSAEKGRSWLRELERTRLVPATNAPVPRDLWGERSMAYLARRVWEGTFAGNDTDIATVSEVQDDPPLLSPKGSQNGKGRQRETGVCPAYRCRAEIRRGRSGNQTVHAVLHGQSKRGSAKKEQRVDAEVEVDLTGAVGLVQSWLELCNALDDPATRRAAWHEVGPATRFGGAEPSAQRRSHSAWDFLVTGSAARAISEEGRALTQPVGLAIVGEEAVVELLCRFVPADEEARALFALDGALAALLGSDSPIDEFDAICSQARTGLAAPTPHLSGDMVRERVWRLGYYRLAYALREREDFPRD